MKTILEIVEGNPSLVVNISSNMGSITENTTRVINLLLN